MERRIIQMKAPVAKAAGKQFTCFGPRLPDVGGGDLEAFFDGYNLLGYDNGDGELACSKVSYVQDRLLEVPLSFNPHTTQCTHVPNILGFDKNGTARLVDEQQLNAPSEIYHNFKRLPGTEANNKYKHRNGQSSAYTYADLMGHSFACALKKLFVCNNQQIDINKPTIVMVGRPASSSWEDQVEAYAEILCRHLKKYFPEYHCQITILVLSESCAAMAGAVDLNQYEWLQTVSQIADLGSSTFDFITVTPNGIPQGGEDSYRFGGNDLDKNMAEYGDHFFDHFLKQRFPENEGYAMQDDPGRIAKLRFKKEQHYGDNGKNVDEQGVYYIYYVSRRNNRGKAVPYIEDGDAVTCHFPINRNRMQCILTNNEQLDSDSFKYSVENRAHRVIKRNTSWQSNCHDIMQTYYNNTTELYDNNQPRRLILTGGVSNMPEVQDIARDVFQIDGINACLVIAPNPSLTVSRGLALILGNELIKKHLLAQLKQEIFGTNGIFPSEDSLLDALVHAACEADLDYYEMAIRQWADGNGDKTLNSCIELICNPNNGLFNPNEDFVRKACEKWVKDNKIAEKTQEKLSAKFRALFPEVREELRFEVTQLNLAGMPIRELNNPFPINIYMFFDKDNCPEDPFDERAVFTPAQRRQILAVFKRHRDALERGGAGLDYGNGYAVSIESFDHLPNGFAFEGRHIRVASIDSIYRAQLNIHDDARPIRESIMERLKPQINDFVESLTYYLSISAGRRNNN